jgi:predicted Zn-dependent protease
LQNDQEARALADLSLRETPLSTRHEAFATLSLTRAGEVRRAETLLNELKKKQSLGTALQEVVLPSIQAAVDLDQKNPAAAIEELRRAIPYDLGADSSGVTRYYRGLAYLELKSGKEAADQFRKILDNRGVMTTDVYWPLAQVGLARAYKETGDTAKSLGQYREFLACWKNADADLRILKKAKGEYKELGARLPPTP